MAQLKYKQVQRWIAVYTDRDHLCVTELTFDVRSQDSMVLSKDTPDWHEVKRTHKLNRKYHPESQKLDKTPCDALKSLIIREQRKIQRAAKTYQVVCLGANRLFDEIRELCKESRHESK